MTRTPYTPIAEGSQATPGLWNAVFSALSTDLDVLLNTTTSTFSSSVTVTGDVTLVGPLSVQSGPVRITDNSNSTDYIFLTDSSNQRSSYIIGSKVGGTADGLNVWDNSGQTMIVGFSKQSVRFWQPTIGQFYDHGGIITNVKAYGAVGDGIADDTTLIQNALNATVGGGIVAFPAGTYRITSTLSAGARQILRGQGWNSILSSQFSGILLVINANTTDPNVGAAVMSGLADGFALEDMRLFSNSTQSSVGLSIVSFSLNPLKTVRIGGIRNVQFQGFDVGTDIIHTQGIAFYLTEFLGNRIGVNVHDNSQLGIFAQCDFRANTEIATWMQATNSIVSSSEQSDRIYGWLFDRCHWEINTGKAIVLDGAAYNTFMCCKLEQNSDSFSYFTDRTFRPDGNTFITCTWNGTPSVATVLFVDAPVGVGNTWLVNQFNAGNNSGVSFGAATSNNMLLGCVLNAGLTTQLTDRSTGSQNIYLLPANNYVSLVGSATSTQWFAPSVITAGTNVQPAVGFMSEQSLGLFRSAISTLKQSYGTFDFSATSAGGPFRLNGDLSIASINRIQLNGAASNLGFKTDADGQSVDVFGSSGATGLVLRPNLNIIHFGNSTNSTYFGCLNGQALLLGSQPFGAPSGSAVAPGYAWSSETSLGIYRSGTSTIALSYGTLDVTGSGAVTSLASITVKSGPNNSCGTAVLGSLGSVNVANTYVKTGDLIFLTDQTPGGTLGDLEITGIRNSSGFTIASTSATDTSTVAWLIVRPG